MSSPAETIRIPLSDIKLTDRYRNIDTKASIAEITSLKESIQEQGLIQPVVINHDFYLVAGGKRHRCFQLLYAEGHSEFSSIPVVFNSIPTSEILGLELAENLFRSNPSWQDTAVGIARFHELKKDKAGWTQKFTGQLLGTSHAQVSYCTTIAPYIIEGDPDILSAKSILEAYRKLLDRKKALALKLLNTRNASGQSLISVKDPSPIKGSQSISLDIPTGGPPTQPSPPPKEAVGQPKVPTVTISKMLYQADCIEFIQNLPNACVDHIVTDPPYAIDMDDFEGRARISQEIIDEHQVEANLQLLTDFFDSFPRILKPGGIVAVWVAFEHANFIQSLYRKAGLYVQAYPLAWKKLHPCKNRNPGQKWTSRLEFCLVGCKGTMILHDRPQTNVVEASGDLTTDHPFYKPFPVWNFILESIALPGQTIGDFFAGEMSCPIACIRKNLRPLAVEKVESHYHTGVENVKSTFNDIFATTCKFN